MKALTVCSDVPIAAHFGIFIYLLLYLEKNFKFVKQILTHHFEIKIRVKCLPFKIRKRCYLSCLFSFRDCNKVQEKRGAVFERVTTINQEIQKIKFGIQQLKDATEREKLKSQVRMCS
jgi:hypothetical protein